MNDKKWYLLHTKLGKEKKIAEILGSRGIPSYCPLTKLIQPWRERGTILYCALFPTYVFVQLDNAGNSLVNTIPGVLGFVYWLGEPSAVPAEEIESIRNFLHDYSGIKLEKTPVDKKDRVRIIYGPLVVRKGNIFEVRNSPVSVILPSIGYVLVAQERKRQAITKSSPFDSSWTSSSKFIAAM